METVFCPVINGQVNGALCLKIVLVSDREAKPTILADSINWNEQLREICKNCKYHACIE